MPKCLKSIAYQKTRPDKVVLYLSREECEGKVPNALKRLEKYGLAICMADGNLKPHNKYFYAIKSIQMTL